ncbi:hypothetical protein P152DRAFT_458683 [Eremomyces bilateralis CBS 781.70]|uniref:GID complex catalytic subunit 2 n=1 Tax=Eremomyces bilateralis CBS 781.70 TaxID=1392243 RepID=A0A6G1G313_9PEZI|nr:uncharacterized protein P152DRAFT_458683 [Eremomyces bilateralis CBS 781.70]KAF1812306.1 hypothetical protein P152DRAFT_458683 [Eremomyces bilateralis CBS 781.70]
MPSADPPPPAGLADLHTCLGDMQRKDHTLQAAIDEVQVLIDMVENAKRTITADPSNAATTLVKLQSLSKQSLDKLYSNVPKKPHALRGMHNALGAYEKALNKRFKDKPFPSASNDVVSSQPHLLNRAIAMHLLREGQFNVANTFILEAKSKSPHLNDLPDISAAGASLLSSHSLFSSQEDDTDAMDEDPAAAELAPTSLQQEFAAMHHILHDLRINHNLLPAIDWARRNSHVLETRGSNLEFELCRLEFIRQFVDSAQEHGDHTLPLRAWAYARSELASFAGRYAREIHQLSAALAFWPNIATSPYRHLFDAASAWEEVAGSFTREFCSLLELSADSPLYVAATAGAVALPPLMRVQKILANRKAEWTSREELPVEIPLPPAYHFHSVFVCPVSKEQSTDSNPPMLLPCGHVIAKESLEKISKGTRFKCPYCPMECHPRDAKKVYV